MRNLFFHIDIYILCSFNFTTKNRQKKSIFFILEGIWRRVPLVDPLPDIGDPAPAGGELRLHRGNPGQGQELQVRCSLSLSIV